MVNKYETAFTSAFLSFNDGLRLLYPRKVKALREIGLGHSKDFKWSGVDDALQLWIYIWVRHVGKSAMTYIGA